jgi:hypothetical protein
MTEGGRGLARFGDTGALLQATRKRRAEARTGEA